MADAAEAQVARQTQDEPMETMTLGAARAAYYERNHFGADGGDSLDWVPLKVFGMTLKIPNTDGRRRAVRIHDLHHVVTGYETTLAGESEIGAWELASGCLRWPAATVLNMFALGIGLVIAPLRVIRAWARGRQTKNLYGENGVDHLLPRTVADMRHALGLDAAAPRVRLRDAIAVIALALPMLAIMAAPLLAVLALLHAVL
jgi:hypothetical protein